MKQFLRSENVSYFGWIISDSTDPQRSRRVTLPLSVTSKISPLSKVSTMLGDMALIPLMLKNTKNNSWQEVFQRSRELCFHVDKRPKCTERENLILWFMKTTSGPSSVKNIRQMETFHDVCLCFPSGELPVMSEGCWTEMWRRALFSKVCVSDSGATAGPEQGWVTQEVMCGHTRNKEEEWALIFSPFGIYNNSWVQSD